MFKVLQQGHETFNIFVFHTFLSFDLLLCSIHRHLRETDRSLAIVGSPTFDSAMALNPGANQCTSPAFSAKACFMVAGDITSHFTLKNHPMFYFLEFGAGIDFRPTPEYL